jgi:hypothetical protein
MAVGDMVVGAGWEGGDGPGMDQGWTLHVGL